MTDPRGKPSGNYKIKSQALSKFPIYKSGKIASEPQDIQNGAKFYIDTKTKPGMSGSIVVQKEEPEILQVSGNKYQFKKDKINFIGIYSGRAGKGERGTGGRTLNSVAI